MFELDWIKCLTKTPPPGKKLLLMNGDKYYVGTLAHRIGNKFYFHLDSGSKVQARVASHYWQIPNFLIPNNIHESNFGPEYKQEVNSLLLQALGQHQEEEKQSRALAQEKLLSEPTPEIVPPPPTPRDDEIAGYSDGLPVNHKGEPLPLFGGNEDW